MHHSHEKHFSDKGISDLSGLHKSPQLKDEHHFRRNGQLTLDTAMNDFNSGQFKTQMKKMATQVNFYLCLNAFLSLELLGAWKLAHICPIKVLLTFIHHAPWPRGYTRKGPIGAKAGTVWIYIKKVNQQVNISRRTTLINVYNSCPMSFACLNVSGTHAYAVLLHHLGKLTLEYMSILCLLLPCIA